MNRTNKEQILFILALLILGSAAYFQYGDSVSRRPVPRSREADLVTLDPCPNVQFLGDGEGWFSSSGRNIFAPPRDWFPLQPLRLDMPPGLELDPVWPQAEPSLAGEFLSACTAPMADPATRENAATEGATEGGERTEAEADGGGGDEESGAAVPEEDEGPGIDLSGIKEEVDPEVALMARYDWIKLNRRSGRVFGRILNEDKFALLDSNNSDPIRLRRWVERSGKWAETFAYERADIAAFGIAKTVANRYQLRKREIIPNAANIARMHDLARWCLDSRSEDPEAVGYAIEMARLAVEQDPLFGASYLLLADIYETAFELERELEVLKDAIGRGIREPGLHVRYGRFLDRYGLSDLAVRAFYDGMQIRPSDAEALLALADVQMKKGLHTEALKSAEEALRSPSLAVERKADALISKGKALLALNRLADAAQEAGRAIHLDAGNVEAWNLKGSAALAGRDVEGALETFRRALETDPENAGVLTNLGIALLAQGDIEAAVKRFSEAIGLDPFFSCRALVAQGFAWQILGETDKAFDCFDDAVKVAPDDAYALAMLGRFQRKQGDPDAAVETLKRALRINGRIAAILGELGHACLDMGRYEDAAFYFKEYSSRGCDDFKSLFLQGIVSVKLDRIAEAEDFFKRAADRANKSPEPLNGLAMTYYLSGKAIEALDTFARVLRLYPEDSLDPIYRYAFDTRAAIETHLRKSQWVDRFQRKEIKNGWEDVQRYGPKIYLAGNEIHFRGMQRQGVGGEMTQLRRVLAGKAFRLLEAEIVAGEGQQGTMGIFVGSYSRRSGQGLQAQAEVRLGIDQQGNLLYRVLDQGRTIADWTEIEGQRFDRGEPVKLGIEVADHEKGILKLSVNDTSVVVDLSIKKMKKITRNLTLGIFGVGAGGRNLDFTARYVRIVKTGENR